MRRDFHGIYLAVARHNDIVREAGCPLKIVDGEHDATRHGIGAQETFGQLAKGLHLNIAPLATRFASLAEPEKLTSYVACELSPALFAAASGKKCDICGTMFLQPADQPCPLGVALQPIEAQFDGPGDLRGLAHLPRHCNRRGGGRNGTNPPYAFTKQCHPPPCGRQATEKTAPKYAVSKV